ncbi:MAG: methylmalonyl Co-A mutase-associated GTPase MeaB [Flavobacteriales bacterium]
MPQDDAPKKNQGRTAELGSTAKLEAQQRIQQAKAATSDIQQWASDLCHGSREALSRAITLAESTLPSDRARLERLLKLTHQPERSQSSWRIGITGVPGVGKSTFIEEFGLEWLRKGHRVAVLAVDPSSQRSGGSILGDKTRMERLTRSTDAFIRPSPAAKTLGGVSRATHESILLCEAAGFDRILVETVGVGQSETEVKNLTDVFLLLMLAGAGDELQGIKRGIMEMADLILINKCDGLNIQQAQQAVAVYKQAIHLFPVPAGDHQVEVTAISALENTGIESTCKQVESLMESWRSTGWIQELRSSQCQHQFERHIRDLLIEQTLLNPLQQSHLEQLQSEVQRQHISAFAAARLWIQSLASKT